MKNEDMSNMIASQMYKTLSSPEHQEIFGLDKTAQTMAEKADAKDKKEEKEDSHSAKDSKESKESDEHSAKDSKEEKSDKSDADDLKAKYPAESWDADDGVVAFDEAISNLLKASSALDAAGLEKSASLTLDLAGFVVEAKKKADKKKKSKKSKDSKKSKESKKSKDSKESKKDSKDSKKSK